MKKDYSKAVLLLFSLGFIPVIFVSCENANSGENPKLEAAVINIEQQSFPKASDVIKNWPEKQRKAAQELIQKYGEPTAVSSEMISWENNGNWKRTIVYKEEVTHNFPMPHADFVEQVIDYKAPLEKYDEIAMYDGSVLLDRTKGEMAARCDKEAMNYLAINLAHEVATGKKSVSDARNIYARTAMAFMKGEKPEYTQSFQFQLPTGNTADPDKQMKMEDKKVGMK
ncbi:MAG: hypothetical protein ACK40G_16355 [Cytophagaceae bacterium]